MTVVVAEKRHHIRFFPPSGLAGDKNSNPVPGTLVEHDVTHPWENDLYLCSHVAIQGTARPTHYHMLMDEANLPVEKFQTLLYEHCYQYQRATTPVSLCKSQSLVFLRVSPLILDSPGRLLCPFGLKPCGCTHRFGSERDFEDQSREANTG